MVTVSSNWDTGYAEILGDYVIQPDLLDSHVHYQMYADPTKSIWFFDKFWFIGESVNNGTYYGQVGLSSEEPCVHKANGEWYRIKNRLKI